MSKLRPLLGRFKGLKIQHKLLISYVLVVFLPVLVVGIVLTTGIRSITLEQAIGEASTNVDRIEKRAKEELRIPTGLADIIYMDRSFKAMAARTYNTPVEVLNAYRQSVFSYETYSRVYPEIGSIQFYSENETVYNGQFILKADGKTKESAWYRAALEKRGRTAWAFINYEFSVMSKGKYLSLTRAIRNDDGTLLGVLVICMDATGMNNLLADEPYEAVIVSSDGTIVAAKDTSLYGKRASELKLGVDPASAQGIYQGGYRGHSSEIILKDFNYGQDDSGFRIISIVPIDRIMQKPNSMAFFGFTLMAASLLVALALILAFSSVMSRRIRRISGDMHTVAAGDFDVVSRISGRDEIAGLSGDLNSMVKSLKELIHENYEIRLQKNELMIRQKEIKLRMLANQINPHFLFNVLETVKMKALCAGQNDVSDIVYLLGKIMRRTLEIGSDFTSLADEIGFVESYLQIQRYRFSDKLDYQISIDDELLKAKAPPLIVQPIVENAVVHGLESLVGRGMITIAGSITGAGMRISVSDNGVGIGKEELESIRLSLETPDDDRSKRIGLRNVHQRIRMHFGAGYGLRLDSMPGRGTDVEILLPWRDARC